LADKNIKKLKFSLGTPSSLVNKAKNKRKRMNFKQLLIAMMLFIGSMTITQAAGQPVNEDLTLLYELSQDMIDLSKVGDVEGFMKLYKPAVKLAGEGRNNSIVLPRASAKFRAAKKAVIEGKFDEAIAALTEAQKILLWKKERPWNGLLN
jgi:hypothetical protein